jgi:hypothetical protein
VWGLRFSLKRQRLQRRRNRHEHKARFVRNQGETVRLVEGHGSSILRVDDEGESPDAETIRTHEGIGEESAANSLALMFGRDREPPQQHRRNDRIVGQAFRHIGGQGIESNTRCRERVKSRNLLRVIERNEAAGYVALDVLVREFPDIAVERIDAGVKGSSVILARKRRRDKAPHRASRMR